jgi:demethylphylloquinol methyltransferase
MEHMEPTNHNNYSFVARVYDVAANAYSGGQIRACKEYQIPELAAGDKVLYAGAGTGYDAALAAKRGAHVTVVELSPVMAERARARLLELDVLERVEVIVGDVFEHRREGEYDAVVANFFLNVFSEQRMKDMLGHLSRQLRVGGKLLIADFTPEQDSKFASAAQRLYFGLACAAFRILANNAKHPLYDYRSPLTELGLRVEWVKDFPIFGVGPEWYRTLVAVRPV